MSISPADSQIFGSQFNHPGVERVFSDEHYVQSMLKVEAALANVLGSLDLIPQESVDQIESASVDLEVDLDELKAGAENAGFPVIALVRQLRLHVGDEHSRYVHWGATTQDIVDTARVLQVQECLEVIEGDLDQLIVTLAELANRYRDQIMPGRTHSQQALPITFGFKVAGWLAPLLRHRERLVQMKPRVLLLQFGGGVGTLAAYGSEGPKVYDGMARTLDLNTPTMPWHAQRDGFAELASWLSLLSGSLAKIAQDIILLSQTEVGELRETSESDRGGSSTMPQKHNPIQSELIVAAARANTALLSAMHSALVQEHERGTHGLQLESIALPQMLALTAFATAKALWVGENLVVNGEMMLDNLEAAQGTLTAEAVRLALLETLQPEEAEALLREASQIALSERRPLVEVVSEKADVDLDLERLADASQYLGVSQWFIDRVVQDAQQ